MIELIHRCEFATRQEARLVIFEWIEVFYNRGRFHSAIGYKFLWTLKRNSTKPCLLRHPNAVHQIEARPLTLKPKNDPICIGFLRLLL